MRNLLVQHIANLGLSASQVSAAVIVIDTALARGVTPAGILAMLANAYAESLLNPSAYTKELYFSRGEDSVGLFMLNARGAGAYLKPLPSRVEYGAVAPSDPRLDPVTNTNVMLDHEVFRGRASKEFQAKMKKGVSLMDLALVFGEKLERHALPTSKTRKKHYREILAQYADQPTEAVNLAFQPRAQEGRNQLQGGSTRMSVGSWLAIIAIVAVVVVMVMTWLSVAQVRSTGFDLREGAT